jgi:hypothetical protein
MPSVIMLNVVVPISMYWFFLSKVNSLANIYGSALALHEEKKSFTTFGAGETKGVRDHDIELRDHPGGHPGVGAMKPFFH